MNKQIKIKNGVSDIYLNFNEFIDNGKNSVNIYVDGDIKRLKKHATDFTISEFYSASGNNSPCDGYISISGKDESLDYLRDETSGSPVSDSSYTTIELTASSTTNQFTKLVRPIFNFDTSTIPDNATILAASLSLVGFNRTLTLSGTDKGIRVVAATPQSTSSISSGDSSSFGTVSFGSKTYSTVTSDERYTDIILNSSGIANINKSGITSFGITFYDVMTGTLSYNWSPSGTWKWSVYMADSSTNKPKLTIVYEL